MKVLRNIAVSAFVTLPILAHHDIDNQFVTNHTVQLVGTVTRVEWVNPHVRVFMDVKNDQGGMTNWEVDMGSPSGQMQKGWKVDSIRQRDHVTVKAYPAKNGTPVGYAEKLKVTGH